LIFITFVIVLSIIHLGIDSCGKLSLSRHRSQCQSSWTCFIIFTKWGI